METKKIFVPCTNIDPTTSHLCGQSEPEYLQAEIVTSQKACSLGVELGSLAWQTSILPPKLAVEVIGKSPITYLLSGPGQRNSARFVQNILENHADVR